MTDKELDYKLHKGKREAEEFFSHMDADAMRKVALRKAASGEVKRGRRINPGRWPLAAKAGLYAAICCALAAFVCAVFLHPSENAELPAKTPVNAPVAEQPLSLGREDADYMVSFFPVNQPNEKAPGLMSVLWEMRSGRTPEMIYSSLFEKCDRPYPVSAATFPGTDGNIILISSGDSFNQFIHYRMIGFENGAVSTLLSQDFVPQGKLDILNGVVVEKRLDDISAIQDGQPGMLQSYIIPCSMDASGELILPVYELQLRLGDHILLVASETDDPLQVYSEKGILSSIAGENGIKEKENSLSFKPKSEGTDVLRVKKGGNTRYLSVNIVK